MKWLVAVLILIATPAFGVMPYDAVGRIDLPSGGHGSGTLVAVNIAGTKGLVITAGHVVSHDKDCKIVWGDQVRMAKVVKAMPGEDLALLVVDNPPVKASNYTKVQGRMIVVTGYPWHSKQILCWQVGVALPKMEYSMMKVTCRPEPGMSGSGCFDFTGKLVAVVSGHDYVHGYLGYKVSGLLDEYSDPSMWVPDENHAVKPHNYGPSARPEKPYRTIPYNEHTAPKLPL